MTNGSNTNNKSNIIWLIVIVAAVIAATALAFIFLGKNSTPETPPPPAPPAPPEVVVPTAAPGVPMVTASTAINVRSGPGMNYPIYGVAPQGAQAQVLGKSEDGGWWNIVVSTEYIAAGNAWVSAEYVTAQGTENVPVVPAPPLPPDVGFPPPGAESPTVTTIDVINVRSGPGSEYPSYGKAPIGAVAPVVGINADGTWYVVQVAPEISPDNFGWVKADYVTLENPSNVDIPVITDPEQLPPIAPPPPDEDTPMVTAADAVNVRSGPGLECDIFGVAPAGTSAAALGISADGQWYQVQAPAEYTHDGTGWVSADYVIPSNTEGLPVAESAHCP